MILYHKFYTIVGLLTLPILVSAEVVLDGTLGAHGTLQGPNFTIDASLGQQIGTNLFHSFESFNLNSTESATFTGQADISNIISRVTGGQPSSINGLLSSNIPNANVYFINPAGIMFGQKASLNIQGSLYISTADYLKLGKTGRFDATTPNNSLLTVASPRAFGFLDAPSPITLEKSVLYFPNTEKVTRILSGKDMVTTATLSLVGGNISLKNSKMITGGNNVHLISIAAQGEVPINTIDFTDDAFSAYGTLNIIDTGIFERLVFGNIDASGFGGGEVFIRAGQIVLDNGWIFADTWHNKAGRGITVRVNETLTMKNGSRITTEALSVRGFDLNITGNSGNITLSANDIILTDGSQIQSQSHTAGHAGNIAISAQNTLSLIGAVSTESGSISSSVLSNTLFYGNGGEIKISAKNLVMEKGTIQGETWGIGNAGNVFINTDTFSLLDGAQVNVSAGVLRVPELWEGIGKAGQLTVVAKDAVHISGSSGEQRGNSGFFSNVLTKGQGGTIDITTPTMIITKTGTIQTGTQQWGNAGSIVLNVDSLNLTQGGFIFANTSGDGLGGDIKVQAQNIQVSEKSSISASSSGKGHAGNISLNLEDKLTMQNSFIKTSATKSDGGNIFIIAQNYLYLMNSEISTSVGTGLGSGGNITMRPEFLVQDESPIIAEAYGGPGGNINITTTGIYQFSTDSPNNRISASSQYGVDGIVEINTPDNNAEEDVVILTTDFLDASSLLDNPCSQRFAEEPSHFTVVEIHGVPNSPYDFSPSSSLNIDNSTEGLVHKFSMLMGCHHLW